MIQFEQLSSLPATGVALQGRCGRSTVGGGRHQQAAVVGEQIVDEGGTNSDSDRGGGGGGVVGGRVVSTGVQLQLEAHVASTAGHVVVQVTLLPGIRCQLFVQLRLLHLLLLLHLRRLELALQEVEFAGRMQRTVVVVVVVVGGTGTG